MSDTIAEPDVGTLHHLDDHRPVQLTKAPDEAEKGTQSVSTPTGDQRLWRHTARRVRIIATHDRTRTTARLAARHTLYVAGGARIVARRTWDARTAARYERMMRTAEAAGNTEEAKEWEERGRQFRAARHQRRMDLLTAPTRAARAAVVGTAATGGALLGLGVILAAATHDAHQVLAPVEAAVEVVRWAILIGSVVWGMALWLVPALTVGALHAVGAARQAAPRWALPARQRGNDEPITPSIVVTALRDLGIGALRASIKNMEDNGAGMLGPIRTAGCGVEVDITLPSGSSTQEVMKRRRKFAENLDRHEHEVHLSVAPAARTVRAWIADSGALDEPIGPSPVVLDADTAADYAKGRAPWGVDLRGDAALISLHQRHLLITGLSNQGKTASLRALALWVGHDARVQFKIADLKGLGDWAMFAGIASTLIQGPTDEHVIAATEMLEGLVEEMNRRLAAGKDATFPPLIGIVDEAQVAFMCPAIGPDKRPYGGTKATSRYFQAARKIHNQGRAVDVLLWQGTQDPTDQNLPKLVREGAHIRASLVLGTESQARMALGDKAIDGGAAPHRLRQGLDRGVVVVAGDGVKLAPGQPSITVRTHFVDDDQAAEIADRIRTRRDGRPAPVDEPADERDALTDVTKALQGEPRVRTQEVLRRLADIHPTYRDWTFPDLKAALEPYGAEPYKSDGVMVVGAQRLAEALAERARDTPDE